MLKLAAILEVGQTYQVIPVWSHKDRDSYYVKIAKDLKKLEANLFTCVVDDDKQLLQLRKRKSRLLILPYHSIRYVEVSPAADVANQLFG